VAGGSVRDSLPGLKVGWRGSWPSRFGRLLECKPPSGALGSASRPVRADQWDLSIDGYRRHNTLRLDRELGCPYRSDLEWVRVRDNDPAGWSDAIAFDAAIRRGSARANAAGQSLRGQFFLHRQRIPLDQVQLRPQRGDEDEEQGCGPWTCPHPSTAAESDAPPDRTPP
jgi:hypothetical protein